MGFMNWFEKVVEVCEGLLGLNATKLLRNWSPGEDDGYNDKVMNANMDCEYGLRELRSWCQA